MKLADSAHLALTNLTSVPVLAFVMERYTEKNLIARSGQ